MESWLFRQFFIFSVGYCNFKNPIIFVKNKIFTKILKIIVFLFA